MFGLKRLRARVKELELDNMTEATPKEPTITIPIVNSLGEPVEIPAGNRFFTVLEPKVHTISLQEAFDKLQEALGVQLTYEQGSDASVQVYGE